MTCDSGWLDCDGDGSNGCETPTTGLYPHEIVNSPQSYDTGCGGGPSNQVGTIGQCSVTCEPGWFDCNNNPLDGCETQGLSGCFEHDAGDASEPSSPHVVATLSADPRGLVACGGQEFYFDANVLYAIDSVTLLKSIMTTSPGVPAGGLACDGTYLYWATLSDADASTPNGQLLSFYIPAQSLSVVASDLDPGRGIDIRWPANVYFIARSGLGDAGSMLGALPLLSIDAGVLAWMPADETQAYKSFTLTASGDWSLANGSIYRRPLDAGPAVWIDDAGASALLTAQNGEPFAVVQATSDAGADAGEAGAPLTNYFAHLADDAGSPSLVAVDASTVNPIIATTSNGTTIAASDDTVYLVTLPAGGTKIIATTGDHVADVAFDSPWAVWTTRGQGSTPAQVWRAKVQ